MIKFQAFWICLFFFNSSAVFATETVFESEITPAWNGIYKANKATAIRVQLFSRQSGLVKIQAGSVSKEINLKASVPVVFSLPSMPDQHGSIIIKIKSDAINDASIEKHLSFTRSNSKNIAILSDGIAIQQWQALMQALGQINDVKPVSVSSSSLPGVNAGYQAIDVMVMHFDALRNMNQQQTYALTQYISQCGKFIAIQFPAVIYNNLMKTAGCSGVFLSETSSLVGVADQLSKLLNIQATSLPTLKEISTLSADIDSSKSMVLIFGLIYLLIVFVMPLFTRSQLLLFVFPLIATFSTVMVWFSQQPQLTLNSWLDIDSNQSTAQYTALLNIHGNGGWHQQLTLPANVVFSNTNSALEMPLSQMDSDKINAMLDLSLFSKQQWFWQSAISIEAPLKLALHQQGISVKNDSSEITPAGFFIWQGELYALPAIKPGQVWQPIRKTTEIISESSAKLLQKYAQPYAAAVIIPFVGDILNFNAQHHGWLFIHTKRAVSK